MNERPYTPEQVKEIEALSSLVVKIQEFAAGISNNTAWVTLLLNTPKALLENPFEGLDAYGLEEMALRSPSDLTAKEAHGEFVSYLGIVRVNRNDPETLRAVLNDDNWRLPGLINRLAEVAGLYDEITGWEDEEEDDIDPDEWTAELVFHPEFQWEMPDGSMVLATPIEKPEAVEWNFWVQRGPVMYYVFTVSFEEDFEFEGNPEVERLAWSAWHDALPVIDAMAETAKQVEAETADSREVGIDEVKLYQ